MKPPMSLARVRNVCKRTTSRIVQPAASTTVRTFSRACLVWLTTSSPGTRPSALRPTCPATITSSPARATMPCEYIPSGGPKLLGTIGSATVSLLPGTGAQLHVLELDGLAVDAARRRRDPAGELAGLDDRLHQRRHVDLVLRRGQPVVLAGVPLGLADHAAVGGHAQLAEVADGAVEGAVRQPQLDVDTVLLDDRVPAVDAALAVGHVVVAQPLVERGQRRLIGELDRVAVGPRHRVRRLAQQVVVGLLGLLEAALEPGRVEVGRVGRDLRAEEVERDRAVEVQVA